MKVITQILLLTLLSLVSSLLWAHARLDTEGVVPPRSANAGIKTGPCGADPVGTPTPFHAGSTIIVSWVETIDHPGEYRLSFSPANDANFVLLGNPIPDTQDDGLTPHYYSTTVTLPEEPCAQCTLQLIQVMTDRNPPTNYYSCATIAIIPVDQPLPGGGGGTIPTNLNLNQKCQVMIEEFVSFDADADFKLSYTEIENSMNFLDNNEFVTIDSNADGYLQMSEIQAIAEPNNNNNNAAANQETGSLNLIFILLGLILMALRDRNSGSAR